VEHLLNETTYVFNGDVLTDLDLRAMLTFHREHGSRTTIALTPVDDPTQFGLVETDQEQHIQRFTEKPRPEDITTNMINAGTYIIEPEVLSYIPPNQFFMFERGLFPVLLQRKEPMYGYPSRAYWTDIGRPHNYLEVNHDILIGKVDYPIAGEERDSRVWYQGEAIIDPSVRIVGPVVVGPGVQVARGASIIGPTVLGPNCQIGAEAELEGAVLWADNQVGAGTTLRSCVLGRGNMVGENTTITGGAIISDECQIGGENRLDQGIRLWPGTSIKDQGVTF
jgi:mannose-1-phosphate guanylyltransferase